MHYFTIAALMLLMTTRAVQACQTLEPVSEERSFAQASAVFLAHVTRTEETEGNARLKIDPTTPLVEATFRLIEVLKGEPPADGKVRSPVYGPGNCSVPLFAGLDYVFVVEEGGFVWLPGGTHAFFNREGTESKKLLDRYRALARQAP
jgi:hypothetical protein